MKKNNNYLEFLKEHNAEHADAITLTALKKAYLRQYKKSWRKQAKKQKEISAVFTDHEYGAIQVRAGLYGLKPSTYVRQVLLAELSSTAALIPHKDILLKILQRLAMASIAIAEGHTATDIQSFLEEAESSLERYLQQITGTQY